MHLDRLRLGEMDGFNITMPLKETAAALCDSLTTDAERAGSINASRVRSGVLEGESADLVAFRGFLDEFAAEHSSLLVLGSGGSARAALAAADGWDVHLAARNHGKAGSLAGEFGARAIKWGVPLAGAVVVNATPIGMGGEELFPDVVDAASVLIDLPYAAGETRAITRMRRRNQPHVDGYEFLARQAAESFQWWTQYHVEWELLVDAARKG